MNVIDSYLDTLFAPYPTTPNMQRARRELRDMMEDKYTALRADGASESQAVGTVIAEFGSLDEVAPVLGIDAEMGRASAPARSPVSGDNQLRAASPLDPNRALRYADAVRSSRVGRAAAMALFILSPVPLLLLLAMFGDEPEPASSAAAGVGVVAILVLVLIGVLLNMRRGSRLAEFQDIQNHDFVPTARIKSVAEDLRATYGRQMSRGWMIAVSLWVLSAVPVIALSLTAGDNSALPLVGVVLALTMVATGVVVSTMTTWADSVAEILLQEATEDDEAAMPPAIRAVLAVYWPVVVAIFLAWSFLGDAWGQSWVIWPIAGVLYAGVLALGRALRTNQDTAGPRG